MRALRTVAACLCLLIAWPAMAQEDCNNCGLSKQSDEQGPCMTRQERAALRAKEVRVIAQLRKSGRLNLRSAVESIQGTLIWPMRAADGFDDYSYFSISNQVDLDLNVDTTAADTAMLDYNCGMRTYDTNPTTPGGSGFNHDGTDIRLFPFPYYKMENNLVEVIAAADGVIISKNDGGEDRNCVWGTGRPANSVSLMHCDGTITRYVHLKNGSLTTKDSGQAVLEGEYLGIVGSSGNSTTPHLHFEVNDSTGATIDPFFGPCSDTTTTDVSWWADQAPYVNSFVNKLMTYTSMPGNPSCNLTDSSGITAVFDERIVFDNEDTIFAAVYFRHVDQNDTAHIYFYDHNDNLQSDFSLTMPGVFAISTINTPFVLIAGATGRWTIEVIYMGTSYFHNYYFAECEASHTLSGNITDIQAKQASDYIESTQILESPAADVIYQAGNYIELNPGFDAEKFTQFEARIQSCNN